MGAVVSRLQEIDRPQIVIGCCTAAGIWLYLYTTGKTDQSPPVQPQAFPSLPEVLSRETLCSTESTQTSSTCPNYAPEDYKYMIVPQDDWPGAPVVVHPGTIPTIRVRTLFHKDFSTQTCHRDYHRAPRSRDASTQQPRETDAQKHFDVKTQTCRREISTGGFRQKTFPTFLRSGRQSNATHSSTQTCHLDYHLHPYAQAIHDPRELEGYRTLQPHESQTVFKADLDTESPFLSYPSLPFIPEDHVSSSARKRSDEIHPSISTQTSRVYGRDFHLRDGNVDSSSTQTDLELIPTSAVSTQTSVYGQPDPRLLVLPVDNARLATVQTETPKQKSSPPTVTPRDSSNSEPENPSPVICHHHFQLRPEPAADEAAPARKPSPLSEDSVVCHHHFDKAVSPVPEVPILRIQLDGVQESDKEEASTSGVAQPESSEESLDSDTEPKPAERKLLIKEEDQPDFRAKTQKRSSTKVRPRSAPKSRDSKFWHQLAPVKQGPVRPGPKRDEKKKTRPGKLVIYIQPPESP